MYIKSAEEIEHLLKLIGAKRSVAEIEEARAVKLVKNDVNRRVNAELANQTRSAGAAQHQLALIDELEQRGLRDALPDALAVFCDLRERYPDLSLRDLGEMADPPLSKSALYHRVLRLEKLIEANRLLSETAYIGIELLFYSLKRFNVNLIFNFEHSREIQVKKKVY